MRKSPEQILREHVASLPPTDDIAFIDTETGGLDPWKHDVIEVAVIRVDARTLAEKARFASRVRPTLPVNPSAAKINGYSVDDARWAGSNPGFDRRFLDAACKRADLRPLAPSTFRMIDVSAMVEPMPYAGLMPRSGLDEIRAFLGMPTPKNAHRAESDADDALEAYRRLVRFYAPSLARALAVENG